MFEVKGVLGGPSSVRTGAISPVSSQIAATIDRGRCIRFWKLADFSLSHSIHCTSAPECLEFSHCEQYLAYGSISGAVKITRVETTHPAAPGGTTLSSPSPTGHHKGAVTSLCAQPTSADAAVWSSGALDARICVWDRRIGVTSPCMHLLNAHSETVTALEFSPHGMWIASGSDDCLIKLHDIRTGGVLGSMSQHSATVTSVRFHPTEYLLASGSVDKTIRFWNLKSFECVSQSEGCGAAVRRLRFHPDRHLLAGVTDAGELRVCDWEPYHQRRSVSLVDALRAPDMLVKENDECSCLDLVMVGRDLVLLASKNVDGEKTDIRQCLVASTDFENFISSAPLETTVPQEGGSLPPVDPEDQADNPGAVAFSQLRLTKSPSASLNRFTTAIDEKLCRTPPAGSPRSSRRTEIASGMPAKRDELSVLNQTFEIHAPDNTPYATVKRTSRSVSPRSPVVQRRMSFSRSVSSASSNVPSPSTTGGGSRERLTRKAPLPTAAIVSGQRPTIGATTRSGKPAATIQPHIKLQTSTPPLASEGRLPGAVLDVPEFGRTYDSLSGGRITPEDRLFDFATDSKPCTDELLKFAQSSAAAALPSASLLGASPLSSLSTDERVCLERCMTGAPNMKLIMDHRLSNLTAIGQIWRNRNSSAGGVQKAVQAAVSTENPALIVDVLEILNSQPGHWSLDVCASLLPSFCRLLESKHATYIERAAHSLKLIVHNFGKIIHTTIQTSSLSSIGVDVAREERLDKCRRCYSALTEIRLKVQGLQQRRPAGANNNNAAQFRLIEMLLKNFEDAK